MNNRLTVERIRMTPDIVFRTELRLGDVRLAEDCHIPEDMAEDRRAVGGILSDHLTQMFHGYACDLVRRLEEESRGTFDNSRSEEIGIRWHRYNALPPITSPPTTATEVTAQNIADFLAYNQALRNRVMDEQMNRYYRAYMMGVDLGSDAKSANDDREKKAMELLADKIGKEKYKQLQDKGYFEEQGKYGIVRFHKDTQGGVCLLERKKYGNTERVVEWSLCVQSQAADLPKGDVILSRWMEWKQDEDKFLDTANFRSVTTRDEATAGRDGEIRHGLGAFGRLLLGNVGT